MELLRDLEPHRDPHQHVRIGQPEARQRRRLNELSLPTDTSLVSRHLELDTPPRHASQVEDDVEPPWLDELRRDIDHLDFTAAQRQRPPGLIKHLFEHREERIHVTADQTIDILGGAGRRVEPMLKQGAAFEQEQLASILVERTLDRADGHR